MLLVALTHRQRATATTSTVATTFTQIRSTLLSVTAKRMAYERGDYYDRDSNALRPAVELGLTEIGERRRRKRDCDGPKASITGHARCALLNAYFTSDGSHPIPPWQKQLEIAILRRRAKELAPRVVPTIQKSAYIAGHCRLRLDTDRPRNACVPGMSATAELNFASADRNHRHDLSSARRGVSISRIFVVRTGLPVSLLATSWPSPPPLRFHLTHSPRSPNRRGPFSFALQLVADPSQAPMAAKASTQACRQNAEVDGQLSHNRAVSFSNTQPISCRR